MRIAQKMTRMNRFCVEGAREIKQALQKFKLLELYLQREILSPEAEEILHTSKETIQYPVTAHVYQKIALRENKDGIIAVFASRDFPLTDLSLSANPLLVVCQEIQKPGNLGAMIRTTLACGCDALIVIDQKMNIYNPNVIRASLGYVFNAPLAVADSAGTLAFLQANGITIALADGSRPGVTYSDYDFTRPTAVVFGSEAEGLSPFWRHQDLTRIHIPMQAHVDSLNVSVCGGIILYEAQRQRQLVNKE